MATTTLLPTARPVPVHEHRPRLPVPMILESLVQSVEDEREGVLFALRQRPAQGVFEVRFRHPRRLQQSPAAHQLRERRARRDARRAAVNLVANLLKAVLLDTHRKTGNVTTCSIAGLADATRTFELTDVSGPHQMFYDLQFVVSHQLFLATQHFSLSAFGSHTGARARAVA